MNLVSRFRGVTLTVLLLLYSYCDCSAVLNITVRSGDHADLSCSCPPDQPPFFVWQKVVGKAEDVVNWYRNNKEDTQTGHEYQNRTELRLQRGNCSLVFSSVRLSDEGLYKCYYQKKPLRYKEINLKVTDIDSSMACNRSDGVYHCQVTELHPEGTILWRIDDQLLPLSVQCTKDQKTGRCNISDSITLNGTASAKLTCKVANASMKNIVTICTPDSGPVTQNMLMTSSVCGVLTVFLVIVAVFVGITCKKKHLNTRCLATPGSSI